MDSRNADSDVVPPSVDRAIMIEQYEKKVEEFLKVPENAHDIACQVYSRSLIQLLREINKAFRTFPCPLSEEELNKIGIDRATMPASAIVSHFKSKYQGRAGNFNPLWAGSPQANNIRKPPYTARSSYNKKNTKNQRSPPFTDRLCIQKQPERKLIRGENAWVPDVVKQSTHGNVGLDSVEARFNKYKKEIRGFLNKIVPSTYKDLSAKIILAFWKNMDTVATFFELIFNKVVNEPKFAEMYADLCLDLHHAELYFEKEKFEHRFFKAILQKTQTTFEATAQSAYHESVAKLEEKIKEETNEKKLVDLHEQLEELKTKEKRLMLSTIRFISHLYRVGLLNDKIIEICFSTLMLNFHTSLNEFMVEYAIHLIETVGPFVAMKDKDAESLKKVDEYVVILQQAQENVSNRVRFMILALADLSQDQWIKKDNAPKTKDEVETYLVKKEEEWRKEHGARQQSAAADKKRKTQNLVKQPYGGRTSSGNKKDRVNYGFAVSYDAGSSNVRSRDTSSLKVDTQQRLPVTKSWHRSTNAPPAASSQAHIIKGNKPMPSRSSNNAKQYSNDVKKQSNPNYDRKLIASNQKPDSRPASATPPPVEASSNVSSADKFQNKAFEEVFTKAAKLSLNEVNDKEVSP